MVRTRSGRESGGAGSLCWSRSRLGLLQGRQGDGARLQEAGGLGEDGELAFGRVSALAVDTDGTMYVPDDQVPGVYVLSPDGAPEGTALLPRTLEVRPVPFFSANTLWATTRDELGVQRIVRYRIQLP